MFRYSFGLEAEAQAVEAAVRKTLDSKASGGAACWTTDLGGDAKTSQVGDAVIQQLEKLL